MTKQEKLKTLMLISALESYCLARSDKERFPDYLLEDVGDIIEILKADILEEKKPEIPNPMSKERELLELVLEGLASEESEQDMVSSKLEPATSFATTEKDKPFIRLTRDEIIKRVMNKQCDTGYRLNGDTDNNWLLGIS